MKDLNPFEILQIPRGATKEEVEKAYKKLRLKYHPDRKTGSREMYDRVVEAYNKVQLYPVEKYVEVEKFTSNYKGSPEEVEDLIKLYNKHKGDLKKIMQYHLLSEGGDEERLRNILNLEIEKRDLEIYASYAKKVKHKKGKKENLKAEKIAKKLKIDLNKSLEEILNRGREKEEAFLEDLERKYCKRLQ